MRALLFFFLLTASSSYAQHEFMVWTELGAKGKIIKRLSWSGELNTRIGSNGVQTFFPQAGIEYKVKKWFKPSLEYRFIVDKNKYGNYKSSSRLNFNLNFEKVIQQFNFGLRIRYQQGLVRTVNIDYNPDFDQAFRFKPSIEYDIDNSIITPEISAEFFYDPVYGPNGPAFNKVRMAIGAKLELDGPHGISFKYQLDKKFHDYSANLRHVLSLSYAYKF